MVRLLSCAVLAAFACGCAKPAVEAPTPATAPPGPANSATPVATVPEPPDPNKVRLATAASARALVHSEDYLIYLNVNFEGTVLLSPIDHFATAGETVTTLVNPEQVRIFLTRRAREDLAAAGPAGRDQPPRSVIVLRVDAHTPFGKTYGIMRAGRMAGYKRFHWRTVRTADGTEGQIAFTAAVSPEDEALAIPSPLDEVRPVKYLARVTADDVGKLANVTLGDVARGADLGVLVKRLEALKTKHKDAPVVLVLEIDERLLHADVIRVIDAAERGGFADLWPVPIDPKKR